MFRTLAAFAKKTIEAAGHLDDAGRVQQNHLVVVPGEDAQDAVPGGLRLAGHGGQLLSQQAVQQRALARVRLAY